MALFSGWKLDLPHSGALLTAEAVLGAGGMGGYPDCALTSHLTRVSEFERDSPQTESLAAHQAMLAEDSCTGPEDPNFEAALGHDEAIKGMARARELPGVSVVRLSNESRVSIAGSGKHLMAVGLEALAKTIIGSGQIPLQEHWEVLTRASRPHPAATLGVELISLRHCGLHQVDGVGSVFLSTVSDWQHKQGTIVVYVCLWILPDESSWIPTFHHSQIRDFVLGQVRMCADRMRLRVENNEPATKKVAQRESQVTMSVLDCVADAVPQTFQDRSNDNTTQVLLI